MEITGSRSQGWTLDGASSPSPCPAWMSVLALGMPGPLLPPTQPQCRGGLHGHLSTTLPMRCLLQLAHLLRTRGQGIPFTAIRMCPELLPPPPALGDVSPGLLGNSGSCPPGRPQASSLREWPCFSPSLASCLDISNGPLDLACRVCLPALSNPTQFSARWLPPPHQGGILGKGVAGSED